jgi:hypothetical protein
MELQKAIRVFIIRALEIALEKPGSRARNERGALGDTKFRSMGILLWSST